MYKIIASLLIAAVALSGCNQIDESKIALTEEELAFIASHPTVTWAVEDNRPPYIFVEGGNIKGLSVEYLDLISKKTGLKFKPVRTTTFFNSIEALRKGEVDLMTSLRPTPERAQFMSFTPPIAYNGGVFLFRVNTLPRSPLTTGIRKGEAVKEYLAARFPDMRIVEVEDDEESLALLQKGLLDGSVMDGGSADYLAKRSTVKVRQAIINFDYPYSYGYRKDDHVLGSIMTKAIAAIPSKDKTKLNSKWLVEENND